MSLRIGIFGSCVSRDAFSVDSSTGDASVSQMGLSFYYARSNLASIGAAPFVENAVLEKIASPFQRRQVLADMRKDVLSTLATADYDVLLIDFIDQRFKILGNGRDGWLTLSTEYARAAPRPNSTRVLSRDNPRLDSLWCDGLKKFHEAFCRNPSKTKVIINEAYWATEALGEPFSPELLREATIENLRLQRMYNAARETFGASAAAITYADHELLADPSHKWGLAPFHYVPAFYKRTLDSLGTVIAL